MRRITRGKVTRLKAASLSSRQQSKRSIIRTRVSSHQPRPPFSYHPPLFVFSLPRGDGQLGLHLERDELIRWFEHMDHVLQHTRVPAEELQHRHPPTPDYGGGGWLRVQTVRPMRLKGARFQIVKTRNLKLVSNMPPFNFNLCRYSTATRAEVGVVRVEFV